MERTIISLSSKKYLTDKAYSKPGVWSLWGFDKKGNRKCLEVGQTSDMLKEINEDIEILNMKDSGKCAVCTNVYKASKRFSYSEDFYVHKCKRCAHKCPLREKYATNNPRRVDKYIDMRKKYNNLEFLLVPDTENKLYNERIEKEKEYAIKHKSLYWYS